MNNGIFIMMVIDLAEAHFGAKDFPRKLKRSTLERLSQREQLFFKMSFSFLPHQAQEGNWNLMITKGKPI